MNQVFSAYAQGKHAKELAAILGENALSELDMDYARFADAFEQKFLKQGFMENRSIIDSLDISWEILAMLPKGELKRISEGFIEKYHPSNKDEDTGE
jgi:V/A-type H+-transporting ATPase subunit B